MRIVRSFFQRPLLPFIVEFAVLAPLVLTDNPSGSLGALVFLLPWLLILLSLINLPFIAAALQAFHLDTASRCNHALEHATIHFLEAAGRRRLAGRAERNGFRVCGRASVQEIKSAFNEVQRVIRNRHRLPYISRRCGSNIVTALGLALLLLLSVAVISLIVEPPLVFRAAMLAGVVVLFIAMRHGIGNWMQRRFFMSTDFEDVSLRDVLEVQASPTERRPVHFVATIVRTKAHDGVYRG